MANLRDLWAALQSQAGSTSPGSLSMRLLHADRDVRLFAAVSAPANALALVIELPNIHRPKDLTRISTRTFEAVLADFPGLPSGKCAISVLLREKEYEDLFSLLGEEIVLALDRSSSTANACKSVVRCIERWRHFVERNVHALSDDEMRGLIGELVVLSGASARFGPTTSVSSWLGPTGSLRDFELPNFALEVKTYQAETGSAVRISVPQQLESAPERPVYLCVVRLSRSQLKGRTLPEFIAASMEMLKSELEAIEIFWDRLAAAGYLPSQAQHYADRFVADSPQMFHVGDGFPRISPSQIPAHVADVHFSIILAGLSPFAVHANLLLGASAGLESE